MTTKVIVNKDKCIGCGACVAIAPETFDFDEEGISSVINEMVTEKAKEAEEVCPVFAIDIIEIDAKETTQENGEETDIQKDCHSENQCTCDGCECDDECTCDDECDCDDCDCDDCDCCDEHHCNENCNCKKEKEEDTN